MSFNHVWSNIVNLFSNNLPLAPNELLTIFEVILLNLSNSLHLAPNECLTLFDIVAHTWRLITLRNVGQRGELIFQDCTKTRTARLGQRIMVDRRAIGLLSEDGKTTLHSRNKALDLVYAGEEKTSKPA